jgi:hypothetical protein
VWHLSCCQFQESLFTEFYNQTFCPVTWNSILFPDGSEEPNTDNNKKETHFFEDRYIDSGIVTLYKSLQSKRTPF